MAKVFPAIDEKIASWVSKQKMFFVSTAPLAGDGLVNCSPKGMDTFRILDEHSVAYLDLTGSGAETIAHLRENGRIVVMFCAFDGPPKIVRLHGTGSVLNLGTPEFDSLSSNFPDYTGARAIIKIDVERICDSCGYSIPLYEYQGDRDVLLKWADKKGAGGVLDYQKENNQRSIDGLPALDRED